jgi:hypothetical protein
MTDDEQGEQATPEGDKNEAKVEDYSQRAYPPVPADLHHRRRVGRDT